MRRKLLSALSAFLLLLTGTASQAQNLGDIAFTGYNGSPGTGDDFSFVILVQPFLPAGTTIRFTDRGWWGNVNDACNANNWATNVETELVWTSAVNIPYGRQIRIQGTTASYAYGAAGTVTGSALSLSSGGDQIFAYTGTQSAPNIIAGIHMNYVSGVTSATDWDATGGTSPLSTESNRPSCLTNGTYALFITQPGPPVDEVDNAVLKWQTVLSGNPATDRSRINNAANWNVSDVTVFALPSSTSGLPVNFTWIKALEKAGTVSVDWGIGTEEEMKDYIVEKSDDGRLYLEVGKIPATGKKSYSWTDLQPNNGTNYYRVRATEVSGITKYSTVAIVNRSKSGKGINVYPTVVQSNVFSLQVNNLPAGSYKLNIHSALGQLIMSRVINHGGGSATQTINIPAGMQKGMYKVSLTGATETAITSILVQ